MGMPGGQGGQFGGNQGGMMQGGSMAQQMLSQVRSPPPGMPVRSPQAGASPRPGQPGQMIHSPRMQPIPSPRQPMVGPGGPGDASGMAGGAGSEMVAGPGGNQMAMQQQPGPDQGQITPQDQLSKFVETL